jgi:Protein of unknown function (DUF1553)/Protein of unknown function (DUF1549)
MRTVLLGGLAVLATCCVMPVAGQITDQKTTPNNNDKPWAFSPPERNLPPAVANKAGVRNPIDAFILAKMEKAGVKPAPAADRLTLLRRLSFDLTGLPPTPEEVAAFLGDEAPDAYEKLVDRLLASPRYGERWAMYWLDLVRYADSDGFKADDPRPLAWRYRDYVINAFNEDKPYDRFVLEQLAGDELFPGDLTALVATGYNRNYPSEHNAKNIELHRQENLNDMTDTTGLVFLGLTIGCARCHDHKYDPILQTDYYRLQAFFAGYRAKDDQVLGTTQEKETHQKQMAVWLEKTADIQKKMAEVEEPYKKKMVNANKVKYDKFLQDSYDMPAAERTPYQQQMAEMFAKQLQVDRTAMVKQMKGEIKENHDGLSKELAKFDSVKPKPLPTAMVLTDVAPTAPPTYLLQRGDYKKKGKELQPGYLAIFDPAPAKIPPPAPGATTTGRRTVLAKWLVQPDHPLTARVMVNRLWQHHFGRGIVGTPSDFGEVGDRPTHPELLDWLATEFVKEGWSIKKMHRLMVNSATYRQSCTADASALKADADNQLFSRMNRRRLEGEAMRDAMLTASGLLNVKAGGPPIFPELPEDLGVPRGGWKVTADPAERNRRSVYVFLKRNLRYPLFGSFDAPDANESCARRYTSISAPQALMLMNGKLSMDWSRALAGRALREAGQEPNKLVERLYLLTLGRPPTTREVLLGQEFLENQTKQMQERMARNEKTPGPTNAPAGVDHAYACAVTDLCHVMLNVNEFAYVD